MTASRPARTAVSLATLAALCLCGSASHVLVGTAAAADPVIAAAGDVACSSSSSNFNGGNGTADKCRQKYTSDLLVNAGLSTVLVLGDSQYQSASLSGLRNSYDLSWGRVKSITRPAAGNHEYKTSGAAGYFDYFNGVGVATGPAGDRSKGYYSFNVGTWHLIALNSTDHCTIIPCGAGSAQETWLKADLAANADKYCTLAYWHDPRFNSGHDGNADEMQPLFQALYNADADVILGGHAHDYERFAPQNPSGQLDTARGIRQFVVGTGGAFFTSISTPKPNSQIRQNNTYGVLKLTLRPTSYDWQFVSESNKPFTDSGTGQCHGSTPPPPTDTQKPTPPGSLTASTGTGQVVLNWNASTDNVGVTGYRIYRGGTEIASIGDTTSYTDTSAAGATTYSYTVRALDAAGNLSDPSNAASVTTPATTTFTISPEADALVNAGAATTNYATSKLRTDGGSTPEESFLRFTVGGLAGGVQGAKLRTFAYTGTSDGPAVHTTTNSWNEGTITWNTRPLPTSTPRDDKGAIASNSWVEYDVTPFVTGNGTYSFTLATTASDGVDFRSREYATNRPELVLTVNADTETPTPPGNLNATAGAGQVALGWQPSTDNVGVTGYRVYRGGAQIATLGPGATSYTDTGLAPGPYSYTVRAVDAAGNVSDPSNTASATVPDTTKPTPPGNLTANAGDGQVALGWQASTDDVGVSGYRVFRGTTQIASLGAGATSHTDTGLAPGPYSYTVRAVDAAGNLSDPSNEASATVADTAKPSPPGNLTATVSGRDVNLTWESSTDDVAVTGYRIYREGSELAALGAGATTFTDPERPAGTFHYTVRSVDAATNLSDPSNEASAVVPDIQKPTPPGNLAAAGEPGQATLTWQASTDDVGVTGYRVYRGADQIASVGPTAGSYTDSNLSPGDYSYTVRAIDAADNLSDPSNTAAATVPDTTNPTVPGNLEAIASAGQVELSWQASTDDVGVTGYQVYRGAEEVANLGPSATSYTDTGLAPGDYSYRVRALDAAGNPSDFSNTAGATVPDTASPSAPAGLQAVADSSVQVDLTWEESTDDVAVTHYKIYRDDQLIATVDPTTSYSDTVLPGTYSYVVRAEDEATNLSDPSNTATVTVTPPDAEAPTAPQNLTANAVGGGQADLAWDASSDNVAVTGYRIYRNDQPVATIDPGTSYSDPVPPGDYTYVVRALDGADNESEPSNAAEVTVPDTEDPTPPANLTATAVSPSQIDLTWEASADNVAVTSYEIYRDDALLTTIDPATAYSDGVIAPATHKYEVRALDAAGNVSAFSNADTATVEVPDTESPLPPGNLTAVQTTSDHVDLGWEAATDNVGVTEYRVYRDGELLATLGATTSHTDTTVVPGPHAYEVKAADEAGNLSEASNAADITVVDTQRPTIPGNLTATAVDSSRIDLAWEASTDVVGVTGYEIYRDDTPLTTIGPSTTYSDTVLAPATHTYEVRALDDAGNASDLSNPATASVFPPDTEAPTIPGNVLASGSGAGTVELTWDASLDNVGVTAYRVYRGTEEIATPSGDTTSFTDTGRPPGDYSYTVRAEDEAGNISDPSDPASATVPDVEKPSKPGNLIATPSAPGQVDLTWEASSDNVLVTGYKVYRGTEEIAALGAVTSFSDTDRPPGTYSYTVKATDAAENLSDASDSADAIVPDSSDPTAPTELGATAVSPTQIDLSWQASNDDVGVTGYRIYRGGGQIASIGPTTTYSDTTVTAGNTYSYEVRAVDGAGNESGPSNTATATTPAPTVSVTLSPEADAQVNAGAPTTNYATSKLRADGGSTPEESLLRFTVNGVAAGTVRSAKLRVYAYTATADGPGVFTTATSWSETTVNWNTRPARTGVLVDDKGAIPANTWVEYDVTPFVTGSGTYSFGLAMSGSDGVDFRSREYATNQPQLVIDAGPPDNQAPSAPAGLTWTAPEPTRVDLAWQSSTDNVGVTGYRIYREGSLHAGIGPTTSYSDTSVAAGNSYSYEVRAVDAAGNVSDPSIAVTATTPSAASVLTLSPDADARVHEGSPTTNYATSYLRANGGSELDVETFLRFTVAGAPAGVRSAKLRIFSYSGTADGPALYTTNTSWTEAAVNWNTRPARTSGPTDDKGSIPTNTWAEYDVTPFVTGNGTYSFGLVTTSNDGVNFRAREYTANRPELVVILP
jgi:fibronectin type 3 domain-containing protein